MKPSVAYNVSAEADAVERVIGHVWAPRYVRNKTISEYGTVLVFRERGVILSNQLRRAVEKYSIKDRPTLVAGDSFTVEAVELAREINCDLVDRSDAFWTDARWVNRSTR